MSNTIPDQLLQLSHDLGDPGHDLAILGEGNASARLDADTFLVKASGSELRTLRPGQLVRVCFDKCNALLKGPSRTDAQVKATLQDALADTPGGADADAAGGIPEGVSGEKLRPSVETVMHAALLQLPGVSFVGHTHPTAINALTCSDRFEAYLPRRLFPDHVVVCGPSAALVPYVDPGLPLAAAVIASADAYMGRWGEPPKTIFLQNHGFIALGPTALEVMQITQMAVKAARLLIAACGVGTPVFMTDAHVARIAGRDDEHYRRLVLANK